MAVIMSDMTDMVRISTTTQLQPLAKARQVSDTPSNPTVSREVAEGDILELSERGLALAKAANETSARLARIAAIRLEIENGTYETPERIRVTADKLINQLF